MLRSGKYSEIPSTKIVSKKGPDELPWTQPTGTANYSDDDWSHYMYAFMSLRKSSEIIMSFSGMPTFDNDQMLQTYQLRPQQFSSLC